MLRNVEGDTLKLITLNIWGGRKSTALFEFIEYSQDVDIFCLQEVYKQADSSVACKTDETSHDINLDIFSDIQRLLPSHEGYFGAAVNDKYGLALFIKRGINVLDQGKSIIYFNDSYAGTGPSHPRVLQYAHLSFNDKVFMVLNVHGLWSSEGKVDIQERLEQSVKIREFMESTPVPKILCGDFNLNPNTQSLKILADGMDDQIQINRIESTRSPIYKGSSKFADYVLTSPSLSVKAFKVLPDVVSDHAPLFLEFSLLGDSVSESDELLKAAQT